jgi:class 3 adenylate cyclase
MSKAELGTSEDRLWRMIEERGKPGANVEEIDRRIWDLFGEDWAVMFTDLSGFSRNVEEFGILHFLAVIHEHHKLLIPVIEAHDGLSVKFEGDSMMLLFRTAKGALACAIAMQKACAEANVHRKPTEKLLLCVGIGYGRVLRIGDDDVWGREVNAASKLGEDTARAGEILITESARVALGSDLPYELESVGKAPGSDENYRLAYH